MDEDCRAPGGAPPGPAVGRREAEPELGAVGAAAWGQVLAKGPGWASCTSGPDDLDPSSLELRLRVRGQWGTVLGLHVRVMAVPRKGSAADGGRGTGGPRTRQAGASV